MSFYAFSHGHALIHYKAQHRLIIQKREWSLQFVPAVLFLQRRILHKQSGYPAAATLHLVYLDAARPTALLPKS